MSLTESDLIKIAIVTFFTTLIGRWANKILDNLEDKYRKTKQTIKAKIKH